MDHALRHVHIYEYHFLFLSSEACRGKPEEVVIIVGVDALQKGVDELSAVAGEDPFIVSVEEDHVLLDSRRTGISSHAVG
ncbi:hypothetical protein [Corynebacterium gallinarum]|uniref:Uncharacterized protein n=2 Tax=Corynebacterium TaxID=1716 RepID=A0A8I0HQ74_9CORY|nr:hypothetical protein [Corynebacterium gallinarum]MBD8029550.1 hypothetical protein [Corynebacterium gallinarum]